MDTHEGRDVELRLTGDEALVLHAWLARFNETDGAVEDQAEQRVLWDLEAMLEKVLVAPLRSDYRATLAAARDRVRDEGEA